MASAVWVLYEIQVFILMTSGSVHCTITDRSPGPDPQTIELNTLGFGQLLYISLASVCWMGLRVGDNRGLCGREGIGIWLGPHGIMLPSFLRLCTCRSCRTR